jgi:hypothetical protein
MQVTWVEHSEYDESGIDPLYRPFISVGMGFGAQRWVSALQRQCEFLASLVPSSLPKEDHTGLFLCLIILSLISLVNFHTLIRTILQQR